MSIIVDQTHMGRRASGIERVTAALFSKAALAPLDVEIEVARNNRADTLLRQAIAMPAKAARRPETIWIFPGFPPSPAFSLLARRTVLYVHDLFLIARRQELNSAGRLWLAPNFARAIAQGRLFLANSETTAHELRQHAHPDAEILIYRPPAADVFQLADTVRPKRPTGSVILGALGTLEPRKNFAAAARIAQALQSRLQRPVALHIIGRKGWGGVYEDLAQQAGVTLHGFLPDTEAKDVISQFDALICTSHAEGLGLPLLEVQFGGIPVFAPNQTVFREVLGRSGNFIDPQQPAAAAEAIATLLSSSESIQDARRAALANIDRWNTLASADRSAVITRLSALAAKVARA